MSASRPQEFAGYADRKPSGAEWFKTAPKHWEVKMIKWDSPVRRGASPRPIDDPKYFDDNGEYAWVRISDVTKSRTGYLFETEQRLSSLGSSLSVKLAPGALFLSIAATVGKPCIAQIRCCIHDGFVYFPFLKMLPRFMWYIFEAGEAYKGLGKLGTQLNLNTNTVGTIKIPVPPATEQLEIAGFLDRETARIDELIATKERLIGLFEEKRLATIDAAVTGELLRLEQHPSSNLWYPKLPSDWAITRSKYVCSRIVDGVHHTPEYVPEGVPFVTVRNLTGTDDISFEDLRYISQEDHVEFSRRTNVRRGDILLTKDGTLGVPRVVETDKVFNIFVSVALLKPIRPKIDSYYLRFALESKRVAEQFMAKRLGSGLQHLHLEEIGDVQIPLPPRDVQETIVRRLRQELTKMADLSSVVQRQMDKLREYRTALISAAVTGQIDVRTYRKEPETVLEAT